MMDGVNEYLIFLISHFLEIDNMACIQSFFKTSYFRVTCFTSQVDFEHHLLGDHQEEVHGEPHHVGDGWGD